MQMGGYRAFLLIGLVEVTLLLSKGSAECAVARSRSPLTPPVETSSVAPRHPVTTRQGSTPTVTLFVCAHRFFGDCVLVAPVLAVCAPRVLTGGEMSLSSRLWLVVTRTGLERFYYCPNHLPFLAMQRPFCHWMIRSNRP